MPFQSKRQARWMFATDPDMARRWAHHTGNMKALPETKNTDTDSSLPEKKGVFVMADPIAGLAKQAADNALLEKLAADTHITPGLVRHLASLINIEPNRFVKLAYADPADYTIFLKVASGAVPWDSLSEGAKSGTLVKMARDTLGKALTYLKQKGTRAIQGAKGSTTETGGILGSSLPKTRVGKMLYDVPGGKSIAGRTAAGGVAATGVGATGYAANEAIPGNRFSSPKGGAAGAGSGMANGAMPEPPAAPAPNPAAAAGGAQAPGAGGAAPGGLSGTQKGLLAGGGLAAGALGVGAMMRNRKKKKEVMAFDQEFAKRVMIRAIEKRSADEFRKQAAATLIGYLDLVAAKMSTEKTAAVRKLQAAVAEGKPLSHAIKLAYPHLTGEQRGILACDMVEKAAKYQKGKSGFESGKGGMKVSGSKSGTCKPGDASGFMAKMGSAGFTKQAKALIQTIMRNKAMAGIGAGIGGAGAAGAAAGSAIKGQPSPQPGQNSLGTLNGALKPK